MTSTPQHDICATTSPDRSRRAAFEGPPLSRRSTWAGSSWRTSKQGTRPQIIVIATQATDDEQRHEIWCERKVLGILIEEQRRNHGRRPSREKQTSGSAGKRDQQAVDQNVTSELRAAGAEGDAD